MTSAPAVSVRSELGGNDRLVHRMQHGRAGRHASDQLAQGASYPPHQCAADAFPARLPMRHLCAQRQLRIADIANDLGIIALLMRKKLPHIPWNRAVSLIRGTPSNASSACAASRSATRCRICSVWDVANTGSRTTVDVSLNRKIKEADCALCGQCITHCPVGALHGAGRYEKRVLTRWPIRIGSPSCRLRRPCAPLGANRWACRREFATVRRLVRRAAPHRL